VETTVSQAVTQSDLAADKVAAWVNDEARPLLQTMRQVLNDELHVTLTAQTTGAAPTVVWASEAMPTDSCWLFEVRAVSVQPSGGTERAAYVLLATFRNAAGVVGQDGATSAAYTQETTAGMGVSIAVSGQTVEVSVTGLAATTLDWTVHVQVSRSRR
jgi:hypothetical protein